MASLSLLLVVLLDLVACMVTPWCPPHLGWTLFAPSGHSLLLLFSLWLKYQ